jgi:hypothetical protein
MRPELQHKHFELSPQEDQRQHAPSLMHCNPDGADPAGQLSAQRSLSRMMLRPTEQSEVFQAANARAPSHALPLQPISMHAEFRELCKGGWWREHTCIHRDAERGSKRCPGAPAARLACDSGNAPHSCRAL